MSAEETELLTVNQNPVAVSPPVRQSTYRGVNTADFDVNYGHKADDVKQSVFGRLLAVLYGLACTRACWLKFAEHHIPVINLIRTYKFTKYIPGDILSGLSVGVMTIPQSMGYALLASVPAKFGLYTSLFPVLIYFIFGTSRHVSLGTMAISSLVIRTAVQHGVKEHGLRMSLMNSSDSNATDLITDSDPTVKIAMSVSLTAGIILFIMSLFRLGFIVSYMSDSFISGYLAACNILVIAHQVKLILGFRTQPRGSVMEFFYLVYDVCLGLHRTNLLQLVMSLIAIVILVVVKKCVNERFKSRLKIPIPVDLIIVIIATIISYFAGLESRFDVKVVKEIPQRIPEPVLPSPALMYQYLFEGFMLAIVSYMMVAMMAVLFSQRHDYPIDNNQELAANGLACIGGAFFNSIASSTSPPRCFLMESTGGKTQVSYLVSALLVLITVLAIAPLFQALPLCILASVVIVACIPLFVHYTAWITYWRTDRYDFAIWMVTCFGTFFAGVDLGLLIGVGFSLVVVHFRMQHSQSSKLALNTQDFVFLDTELYGKVSAIPGTSIFHFASPLYFATLSMFKQQLFANTVALAQLKKRGTQQNDVQDGVVTVVQDEVVTVEEKNLTVIEGHQNGSVGDKHLGDQVNGAEPETGPTKGSSVDTSSSSPISKIIVDCSAITFLDTGGARLLAQLHSEYWKYGVNFVLAACSDELVNSLKRVEQCSVLCSGSLYPTVHSAVLALCADVL